MIYKIKQPRKIVSVEYSYLISLPIPWLKHHGLGKGDYLDFELAEDGSLIVKPYRGEAHGKTAKAKART